MSKSPTQLSHFLILENYFTLIDFSQIFDKNQPLEIDLGCGDGKFVLEMAAHYPERNFLAIERLLGRAKKVARKAQELGLTNLKVLRIESNYLLEWLIPAQSVARIHLLCPDPWPKKRHHKNRLLQNEFLDTLANVMHPDQGEFIFKTDSDEYFEWGRDLFDTHAKWQWSMLDTQKDLDFYPQTDFELQWLSQGLKLDALTAKLDTSTLKVSTS